MPLKTCDAGHINEHIITGIEGETRGTVKRKLGDLFESNIFQYNGEPNQKSAYARGPQGDLLNVKVASHCVTNAPRHAQLF